MTWKSIDESFPRRAPRPHPAAPRPPAADRGLRLMETAVVWLMSVLTHAVLGFFLVLFYIEVQVDSEPVYSVTIWRDAKGKDVLRIGAPEEGPPVKGVEAAPEPPKAEPPKPAPPPPVPVPAAPVAEPAPKVAQPVPPPPKVEPEGGAPEAVAPAVVLGAGTSAGVPAAETPGLARPSSGGDVTDEDIDRDPTAAIGRRRSGALTGLRGGSRRDIVVVTGSYDTIQEVLDRLEIPYSLVDPEQLPRVDLSTCKVLLINCHNMYVGGLFRLADTGKLEKDIEALEEKETALRRRVREAKDKRKVFELGLELLGATSQLSSLRHQLASVTGAAELVENVRSFVASGGYVFTSDWGLTIVERAFPGVLKNGGNIGPRKVSLRARAGSTSPLLEEVFGTGRSVGSTRLLWEVDSGSYMIKVEKPLVEVLVETVDVVRNPAVAVAFTPEKSTGKVLHILSHFQRQATKQGDYALQNLVLNFMMERIRKGGR